MEQGVMHGNSGHTKGYSSPNSLKRSAAMGCGRLPSLAAAVASICVRHLGNFTLYGGPMNKMHSLIIWSCLALSAVAASAQDVVVVSPATNKILVENPHVRVLESTFKPGAKEGLHTHPAGWYYVT